MRYLIVLLLSVSGAWAQVVTNHITRVGIGGIPECKDSRVFCVGKQTGAEYSVIGGATCSSATSDNAAGSALKAAKDSGLCAITTPCVVRVGPGLYQECFVIDEMTDVAVVGAGIYATIVRPAVTTATDIDGGVCRIGMDVDADNSARSTARIELSDLTCWNDATSSPEAGVQVGEEGGNGSGNAATWTDVSLHNYRSIGVHDSTQWYGSSLTTDTDLPVIWVRDAFLIGGADTLVAKGFTQSYVQNVTAISWSNYCESTDTAELAAQTGTVTDSTSTTTIVISDPGSLTNNFYAGRRLRLNDRAGGGTCPADCTSVDNDRQVTLWDVATATATVNKAWNLTCDPDAECDYTIAAVGMADASPCTDIDWTVIKASDSLIAHGHWKATAYHHGVGTTPAASPSGDLQSITGSSFLVYLNDFGPVGASCASAVQTEIAGMLMSYAGNDRTRESLLLNNTVDVRVNADSFSSACSPDIVGVGNVGAGIVDGVTTFSGTIRVDNTADDDAEIACIASTSSGTASLSVPIAVCDINNTGGGTSSAVSIIQANSDTLTVGSIVSPDAITTSGTITHLPGMLAAITGTVAEDLADPAGACVEGSAITVTGAVLGDSCVAGFSAALPVGVSGSCRVTADDEAKMILCGTGDPASMTYTARVTK